MQSSKSIQSIPITDFVLGRARSLIKIFPGLSVALCACLSNLSYGYGPADSQRVVKAEDLPIANPVPSAQGLLQNNAKHKVLLAEIDSGVDYLHPRLQKNFHFKLDASGKPIGLGYDFIGRDPWPYYGLVRTFETDRSAYDDSKVEDLKERQENALLLGLFPEMSPYLNPKRSTEKEISSHAYHGTHVAGLMTYDRPDFGLLAYRILPNPWNTLEEKSVEQSPFDDSIIRIGLAIDRAAKDGAKIVNLSVGLSSDSPNMVALIAFIKAAIDRHPDILFVASAGNDFTVLDGERVRSLVCGTGSPNLLCVGALARAGGKAEFSNMILGNVQLVFVLGEEVLSTLPSDLCMTTEALQYYSLVDTSGPSPDMGVRDSFRISCRDWQGMGALSGTSMASPLAAHLAGEILAESPGLKPTQIIQKIKDRAKPGTSGGVSISQVYVKKPSWYGEYGKEPAMGWDKVFSNHKGLEGEFGAHIDGNDPGYWTAYLP